MALTHNELLNAAYIVLPLMFMSFFANMAMIAAVVAFETFTARAISLLAGWMVNVSVVFEIFYVRAIPLDALTYVVNDMSRAVNGPVSFIGITIVAVFNGLAVVPVIGILSTIYVYRDRPSLERDMIALSA